MVPPRRDVGVNRTLTVALAVVGVCVIALVLAQLRGSATEPGDVSELRSDAIAACTRAVDPDLRDACACAFDRAAADPSIDLLALDGTFERGFADAALRDVVAPCRASSGEGADTSG